MGRWNRSRRVFRAIIIVALLAISFQVSGSSSAYDVIHHWQNFPSNTYYGIDPNFDSNLGISGATTTAINGVLKWNKPT